MAPLLDAMELSPDIFVELSENARFERDTPFADRRGAPRVVVTIPAMLVRLAGGKPGAPAPARVVDLSARGVGLEFNEAFHVNEAFALRFVRRDGSPLWIHCVVARWQPIGENRYSIGGKFVKILVAPKGGSAEGAASAPAAA